MLFARVNRGSPEKIFVVVYNSHATTAMTNGQAVIWDYPGTVDGVAVTFPTARATHSGVAFAGIVAESIAIASYGLIQVYGYHSAVRARSITNAAPAIAKGSPLAVNAAGSLNMMESFSVGTAAIHVHPGGFALAAQALSQTTAAIAVFIKAL